MVLMLGTASIALEPGFWRMSRSQFYFTMRSRINVAPPPAKRSITAIINGCTDSDTTPNLPWRHDRILTVSGLVRLVSAADTADSRFMKYTPLFECRRDTALPFPYIPGICCKIYNARSQLKDCRQLGDNVKTTNK
jgi:hypothetical protein